MRPRLKKRQKQALTKELTRLRQENAGLAKENARLKARIAKLEERLGLNSSNSSKPPSSDFTRNNRQGKTVSGRKPGGQLGHEGCQRALVPPDQVNKVIPIKLPQCNRCGRRLSGEDPDPLRRQVTGIRIETNTTEYQLHALICPGCQHLTRASLPQGVPIGAFESEVVAMVALLTGAYHLSRRQAIQMMRDFFKIKISLGCLIACERTVSVALKSPVAQAMEYVKTQTAKHADETMWYEGIKRAKVWLWAVFTVQVSVFLVRASRGTQVAKELLGEVFGVLTTDRWCAYSWWPLRWRQLCWAHLKRHFQAFVDAGGRSLKIGEALLKEERLLFEWWHRVRDGPLSRSTFQSYVRPLRQRVKTLLQKGAHCGHPQTEATCRDLLRLEPAMWTFVRVEGVEPTNNAAERIVRGGVLWRKISFGTHSEEGSRFVERMLTTAYTLRQQNRNVFDYVTKAVEAFMRGDPPQSLLPQAG